MSSSIPDMASNLSRYGVPDLLELQVPESRLRQTPLAGSASLGLSDPELRQTRARGSAPRSSRRPGRSGSPDLSRWGAADSWIRGVQPSRRIWESGGEDGNPAPSPVSPESGFLLETAISGLPARSPDPGGRGGGGSPIDHFITAVVPFLVGRVWRDNFSTNFSKVLVPPGLGRTIVFFPPFGCPFRKKKVHFFSTFSIF